MDNPLNYRFIIASLLIFTFFVEQQFGQLSINDKASVSFVTTQLKVGDKMPDILLGNVENNGTEKKRFSDFVGKIIILDFWSTYCSSCIGAFPYMENLQKKFGDKIQIFLVNSYESAEEIQKRKSLLNINNVKFSNLPSIVNASNLKILFPHKSVPHHVWIDSKGIVRLIGASFNTNEEKILELLEGKEITFIGNDNTVDYSLFKRKPVYELVHEEIASPLNYHSLLLNYVDSLGNIGGGYIQNVKDEKFNGIRNTYANMPIQLLYFMAMRDVLKESDIKEKTINQNINVLNTRMVLNVKDTLKYTYIYKKRPTDKDIRLSSFTYEQLLPKSSSQSMSSRLMLEDLNKYFGALYGTVGEIKKCEIDCLVIIKSETKIALKFSNRDIRNVREVREPAYEVDDNYRIEFKNFKLRDILKELTASYCSRNNVVIVDETNLDGYTDVTLHNPQFLTSFEKVKAALNSWGLDIVRKKRLLDMIVIQDE